MSSGRSVARQLGALVAAAIAMMALSATVFGGSDGVDPRGLLLAIGMVAAVVPISHLVRQLPIDREDVPGLRASGDEGVADTPAAPGPLVAWTGRVNGGTSSARAATLRLVPALQELTTLRLADRRGVGFDAAPAAAADLLGPASWSILRPDTARPMEADLPGIPIDTLEQLVTALEDL